ncbi:unnamed protein product [Rotaria socialis]|uniref:Uncharacterized protein n=1 Tax=Rotaria socialis TaxID=392032 RepID=A0A821TA01_9BILA|nr:unnamed protein product [Rotaria socialis]CAF3327816.1 unnamed protein product [Rotaria socialis]CAF4415472.1 unnamed protein product [Rotaria socialis]CAF4870914.1 unnamed protein product [Rotaria socialis]
MGSYSRFIDLYCLYPWYIRLITFIVHLIAILFISTLQKMVRRLNTLPMVIISDEGLNNRRNFLMKYRQSWTNLCIFNAMIFGLCISVLIDTATGFPWGLLLATLITISIEKSSDRCIRWRFKLTPNINTDMDAITVLYPSTIGIIELFFVGIYLFGVHVYVYYKYAA